jgi:transporter family protein
MWLIFALLGQFFLAGRRTTEKKLSSTVDSATMSWLQQFVALPFMIALLPLAVFYNPLHLSAHFYFVMIIYVVFGAIDLLFYFKALNVGDVTVIAPIITLASVSSVIGSYFILDQKPSTLGIIALTIVVIGAYISSTKRRHSKTATNNRLAVLLTLGSVLLRGVVAPIEVIDIRLTNPIYFNLISSLFLIPTVMLVGFTLSKLRARPKRPKLKDSVARHKWGLLIVGITYTASLTFNFYGKLLAPNAGYITVVRTAVVLPMVLIGALFFKEHVTKRQWYGLVVILSGLTLFAFV